MNLNFWQRSDIRGLRRFLLTVDSGTTARIVRELLPAHIDKTAFDQSNAEGLGVTLPPVRPQKLLPCEAVRIYFPAPCEIRHPQLFAHQEFVCRKTGVLDIAAVRRYGLGRAQLHRTSSWRDLWGGDEKQGGGQSGPADAASIRENAGLRCANYRRNGRVREHFGAMDDRAFVPHMLRHTCATRLVAAGVPLPQVMKWMGHQSITVTMRYVYVAPKDLDVAAAALAA